MGDAVNFTNPLSDSASTKEIARWLKSFADTVAQASSRNLIQDVHPSGAALSTLNNAAANQIPFFTGPTSVSLTSLTALQPGGATGTVQYNNGGVFAGMSGTSWNDSTHNLTFGNGGSITLNGSTSGSTTLSVSSAGNSAIISSGQGSAVNTLFVSDTVVGDSVRSVIQNTSTANGSIAGLEVVTGVANAFALMDLNNSIANPVLNFGWGPGVTAGLNINNNGVSVLVLNNGFQPTGPTSKSTSFTPAIGDYSYICSGAGTITITLPTAAGNGGRMFHLKTVTAQAVVSNASNVVPLAGGAAGTAILPATAGKWAIIQFDGTNYHIMAAN